MPFVVWALAIAFGAASFRPNLHYGIGSQYIVALSSAVLALVGGWLLIPALILPGHCLGWKAASSVSLAISRYRVSTMVSKVAVSSTPAAVESQEAAFLKL